MSPFLRYLLERLIFSLLTLALLTLLIYGVICLAPVDVRVMLYMEKIPARLLMNAETYERLKEMTVARYHLNDPVLIQYAFWLKNCFYNQWGWSLSLNDYVLPAIIARVPATLELTLYSLLLIIPMALVSGIYAAVKKDKLMDIFIRSAATFASGIPLFIMAFFLMTIFYINLKWTNLGALDSSNAGLSQSFHRITGLITIDGLLAGRMDIAKAGFQHVALPALTIAASQWALLTRITRSSAVEELQKEYVTAAKSRGASMNLILWRHVFKNSLSVFLSNTAIAAASIVTGVFVVERIFLWPGVSDLLFRSGTFVPDPPIVLGFLIYSIIMVLAIMFILDIVQAAVNPLISQDLQGGSDGQATL